jgi:hypothetical protein
MGFPLKEHAKRRGCIGIECGLKLKINLVALLTHKYVKLGTFQSG